MDWCLSPLLGHTVELSTMCLVSAWHRAVLNEHPSTHHAKCYDGEEWAPFLTRQSDVFEGRGVRKDSQIIPNHIN